MSVLNGLIDLETTSEKIYELNIDSLLKKLLNPPKKPERINLDDNECVALSYVTKQLFRAENMLLEITAPIKVCGDIHGQYYDLLRLFDLAGEPPETKFLFLGDYIDRGMMSLEVISLLFAYKVKYPERIYLLRGNHESQIINRVYGFRQETMERFSNLRVWKAFSRAFCMMPVAAIIEKSIFCCHGGISPELLRAEVTSIVNTINAISRPVEIPSEGLLCDLLWADPMEGDFGSCGQGWGRNPRGCSWTFGEDIVAKFLQKFDLDLIVRGHQVVADGYEFFADRRVVTVFSAPNYIGQYDNAAAVFCLKLASDGNNPSTTLEGAFQVLQPSELTSNRWMTRRSFKTI